MMLACAGHGYASYKEVAKKVENLEASHRILAAADRCKVAEVPELTSVCTG